jgi:hypothetical protein
MSTAIAPILDRLAGLRARLRRFALVSAASRVALLAVGLLGLSFFADWGLDLPIGVRRFLRLGLFDPPARLAPVLSWALALAAALGAVAATRRRHDAVAPFLAFVSAGGAGLLGWAVLRFVAPALRVRPSDDALALRVEERFRSLEDRLAAALDFDRELEHPRRGESAAMMTHVVGEAGEAVRRIEVDAVASGRPAAARLAAAVLAGVAFLGVVLAVPATAALWARRSLALEDVSWPRSTTIVAVVRDGEGRETEKDPALPYVAALGQSLTVLARAKGRVPDEVEVLDRVAPKDGDAGEGGKPVPHRMRPVSGQDGLFEHEFRDVRGDFSFTLRGGDDRDEQPTWRVEVRVPPRVSAVRSDLLFPAYLRLPPRRVEGGALTVPEGTQVTVTFEADADVATAEAVVDEKPAALEPVAGGGAQGVPAWRFKLDAAKSLRYRLRIVTKDGRENDPAVDSYEVAVLPDAPPRAEWTWPRTPVETSPEGRVPLFARTTDDHGVASIALEVRSGSGSLVSKTTLGPRGGEASDGANDRPYGSTDVLSYVPLEIASLRIPEGDKSAPAGPVTAPGRLQVRLVAVDSKGQEGVGEWASIDVVRRDEIERRLAGLRSGVKTDLESVKAELATLRDTVKTLSQGAIGDAERGQIRDVHFKQGKLAGDVERSARSIAGFFHHQVYDRLGATVPTDAVLGILDRRHRALFRHAEAAPGAAATGGDASGGDVDPFPWSVYREVVEARRDKLVFDTGVLDKMITVLERSIAVAVDLAPAAQAAAADAATKGTAAELATLGAAQERFAAGLDEALKAMAEWQSLAEMTMALRRLIDEQEVIDQRIQGLGKKDKGGTPPPGPEKPPR